MNKIILGLIIILIFGLHSATLHPSTPAKLQQPTVSILPSELPPAINIAMPFYAQAPLGDWNLPWREACEEASALLIANAYYQHHWTAEEFNQQILLMIEWEKQHLGKYIDTSAGETAEILNQYLDLQTVIHDDPSLDDVKNILAQGHLIIMFFAGKELGNPNYQNGGPNYHALVVKGYKDDNQIITDDVGTSQGADYVYSWDTLQNAMHDLASPIDNGPKRMIEVWPP